MTKVKALFSKWIYFAFIRCNYWVSELETALHVCFNMYGVTKDHKQRRTSYHLKSQFPTSKKTMDLLEVLQQE